MCSGGGVSARDGGRGGSAARRTPVFQLVGGSPDLGREGFLPKRVRKEPSHLRMSGRWTVNACYAAPRWPAQDAQSRHKNVWLSGTAMQAIFSTINIPSSYIETAVQCLCRESRVLLPGGSQVCGGAAWSSLISHAHS